MREHDVGVDTSNLVVELSFDEGNLLLLSRGKVRFRGI
jgi:hypothetical protein